MKKYNYFYTCFITIIFATLFLLRFGSVSTVRAEENPLEDLFKDFDFDKFLQDMDEAMKKAESEEKVKASSEPERAIEQAEAGGFSDKMFPSFPIQGDPGGILSTIGTTKRDPESLFIDPVSITIMSKNKKIQKPSQESLSAYKQIMDDFIGHILSIKKKVSSMPQLSPEFKETFANSCATIADSITVTSRLIESKKLYQTIFLTPPESNKKLAGEIKQLRIAIIDALKELKKLDDQLVVKPEEEEKETTEDILRKLAKTGKESEITPEITPEITVELEPS